MSTIPEFGVLHTRQPVVDARRRPAGFQRITSLSAVTYLTVPSGAVGARVAPATQSISWRDDYSPGKLSTRTDANTGVCTVATGHGITTSDTVTVWWAGGKRTGMTVSDVTGDAITVDGGSGDNFPELNTAVDLGIDPTATVGNILAAGAIEDYLGHLERFRLIQVAASASCTFNYWGY